MIYVGMLTSLDDISFNPGSAKAWLSKQCSSRSVGFFRSQLVWICAVFQSVCAFVSTTWIKESDRLAVISGCGKFFSMIRVKPLKSGVPKTEVRITPLLARSLQLLVTSMDFSIMNIGRVYYPTLNEYYIEDVSCYCFSELLMSWQMV